MAIEKDLAALKKAFMVLYQGFKHKLPEWRRTEIEESLEDMEFRDWEIEEEWNKDE